MPIKSNKLTTSMAAALLLGSSMLVSTQALAQQPEVGINAAVRNDVTLVSADSSDTRPAVVKEKVYLGDTVTSGPAGALQILLKDQTVFTVGPNCSMTIDEFVYDPASEDGTLSASIKKGTFRFMSGKIASNPNNVKLNSPVASMGIRGTMIEGVIGEQAVELAQTEGLISGTDGVDTENALLVVLRGPGRDNQGTNKRGELDVITSVGTKRLDEAGQAAFVPAAGSVAFGPFTLSVEAMDAFSSALRTAPTGESSSGGELGSVEEAAGGDTAIDEDTGVSFDVKENDIVESLTDATDSTEIITNDPDFPTGPDECIVNPQGDGCGG